MEFNRLSFDRLYLQIDNIKAKNEHKGTFLVNLRLKKNTYDISN